MRCQLGIGCVTACVVAVLPGSAWGLEIARTSSVGGSVPISVAIGAEAFVRFESQRIPGADWTRNLSLQRAELALNVRWGALMRLQIEPDFGGGAVGLRDAFIELQPLRELELKTGRIKTPHGQLDNVSRWDLPSLARGLWSDVIGDRLGFGGRQLAVQSRVKLRELPLKPWAAAAVLGDLASDAGADAAAALGIRALKGLDVQASWHHRAGALVDGGHGNAVAVGALYDRGRWFASLEGTVGHARRLRQDGRAPDRDATFMAARSRLAARFHVSDELTLEPVVGAELVDPEITAGNDLGFEVLGGASLRWRQHLRFAVEADAQLGQPQFVVADRVQLVALLGASL